MKQPIIFLRVAWMKLYQRPHENDIPSGAGSYVTENEDGGEVCNFLPVGNKFYGYARIQKRKNIRIERLGAGSTASYLNPVTVVFFSKNPVTGGQYITGIYKNATLHRNLVKLSSRERNDYPFYLVETKVQNGILINEEDRNFSLPEDGPGQSNIWYVQEYQNASFYSSLCKYLNNPSGFRLPKRGNKTNFNTWQQDVQLRKEIEVSAMNSVADYFTDRGYTVTFVHNENFGWDLEAEKNEKKLLLEVKGLSGKKVSFELTPNEFKKSILSQNFRICVVTNALSRKDRKIEIFSFRENSWRNAAGEKLKVEKCISAKMFF